MGTLQTKKEELFSFLRESLAHASLQARSPDVTICPLCWQETTYEDLRLEHVVPRSVGGTDRTMTLTCWRCNNDQGSSFDSQLSGYQRLRDAYQGYGHTPTELVVNGRRMAANLVWGKHTKDFVVVAKATNPSCITDTHEDFQLGQVQQFQFTYSDGYSEQRFKVALLRAAYLAVFRHYGYEYAQHEIVQLIRRRINEPSWKEPDLNTLICELKPKVFAFDVSHVIAPGKVDGVECVLVMIRLRLKGRRTRSYFGVYLPVPAPRSDEFFSVMERHAKSSNGRDMTVPASAVFH